MTEASIGFSLKTPKPVALADWTVRLNESHKHEEEEVPMIEFARSAGGRDERLKIGRFWIVEHITSESLDLFAAFGLNQCHSQAFEADATAPRPQAGVCVAKELGIIVYRDLSNPVLRHPCQRRDELNVRRNATADELSRQLKTMLGLDVATMNRHLLEVEPLIESVSLRSERDSAESAFPSDQCCYRCEQ